MAYAGGQLVLDENCYDDIEEFLDDVRGLITDKKHCVIWVMGDLGDGKSTLIRQIFHALDPRFGIHRIHFLQDDYQASFGTLHPGDCVLWDEARMNRRGAMRGERYDMMEDMQDIRGLRLVHGWCFPFEDWMDDALEEDIITFRLNVYRRGMYHIQIPIKGKARGKTWFDWLTVGTFRFDANDEDDPREIEYLAKKDAHMRSRWKQKRKPKGAMGLDTTRALPVIEQILGDIEA